MQRVEASITVSVSDLQKCPQAVMGMGEAVGVLEHNRIIAYMVPAGIYEAMIDRLDNLYLSKLAKERAEETGQPVDIDAL